MILKLSPSRFCKPKPSHLGESGEWDVDVDELEVRGEVEEFRQHMDRAAGSSEYMPVG